MASPCQPARPSAFLPIHPPASLPPILSILIEGIPPTTAACSTVPSTDPGMHSSFHQQRHCFLPAVPFLAMEARSGFPDRPPALLPAPGASGHNIERISNSPVPRPDPKEHYQTPEPVWPKLVYRKTARYEHPARIWSVQPADRVHSKHRLSASLLLLRSRNHRNWQNPASPFLFHDHQNHKLRTGRFHWVTADTLRSHPNRYWNIPANAPKYLLFEAVYSPAQDTIRRKFSLRGPSDNSLSKNYDIGDNIPLLPSCSHFFCCKHPGVPKNGHKNDSPSRQ